MKRIVELELCTGCATCYSVCPKICIRMMSDSEGFLYPEIDETECIDCKKCERACPVLNQFEPNKSLKEASAFANGDETVRYNSSSGGFFSALTKKLFDDGGSNVYVFGAKYSNDFKSVIHSFVDNYDDISVFRGSKYTQSVIGDSYKECKKLLDNGKTVCFTGTPCQISGLKSYLSKEYINLFTIDFVCHGVPSPLLWQKYVEYREDDAGAKVTRTSSRRKNDGWKKYSLWFTFANHNEYCQDLTKDPYMQMFLKNVCLRESCYDCKFKTIDRWSDITMADFWGIEHEHPELDDDKGMSFVVVHSEKGKLLFDSIENCTKKTVALESGLKYNPAMTSSVAMPIARMSFFSNLNTLPFEKVIKKYATTPLNERTYKKFRQYVSKALRIMMLKK